MNSGPEDVLSETGEGDIKVVRHWGCELLLENGKPYTVRWDPGYGSGVYVPYSYEEAMADVRRTRNSRLVSRTETTITVTSAWKVVE